MASDVRITDGQNDFSDGVDSSKPPTIQSATWSPRGLRRTQVAWANNVTFRGGGILQRTGWQPLCTVHDGTALYQGGWMYDTSPLGGNLPYLMLSIGGRMYQVRVDTDNSIHDVTGAFVDPATAPQAYFTQGERFMVKQAGDGLTRPLFWDGAALRRSNGTTVQNAGPNISEIPPATVMSYYQGRIWYARNRIYAAGDIVKGPTGTIPYEKTDSILRVTENPLAFGGDGFTVPSNAGNIRALSFPLDLDSTFGEGLLFIFTPKAVYSQFVPLTRTAWIAATGDNVPVQRVVMANNGAVSDRSVVRINGDLFFQSLDPAIRSYFMAVRYFKQWGNTPISNNINRVLQFNDRSLMRLSSGIEFNSRLWQCILPVQTAVGVACQAVAVLDLDPIATLQDSNEQPAWEGMYEGADILQIFQGDFGGLERAFAIVHSRVNGSIQVWELTSGNRFENGDNRVSWYVEFPAMDWSNYKRANGGGPFELKELDGFTLWLDKVFGTVDIEVFYRPDQDACWYEWGKTQICAARTCQEDVHTPNCYPITGFREQYRMPLNWPKPTNPPCSPGNSRPVTWGYQFQVKVVIKGWCRIRGYEIHAFHRESDPFKKLIC